jgi:hypothetical protein
MQAGQGEFLYRFIRPAWMFWFLKNQIIELSEIWTCYIGVVEWLHNKISQYCSWGAYSFSSSFVLDVATESQKDHKLFSATFILCNKNFGNKKIERSPLVECCTLLILCINCSFYLMFGGSQDFCLSFHCYSHLYSFLLFDWIDLIKI